MDEVLEIGGYTKEEALALCCDEFCFYRVTVHEGNLLMNICDCCPLSRFVAAAFDSK